MKTNVRLSFSLYQRADCVCVCVLIRAVAPLHKEESPHLQIEEMNELQRNSSNSSDFASSEEGLAPTRPLPLSVISHAHARARYRRIATRLHHA